MQYRITKDTIPVNGKFFNSSREAWDWIREEINRYEIQGFHVPTFRVTYMGQPVDIEGKPYPHRK